MTGNWSAWKQPTQAQRNIRLFILDKPDTTTNFSNLSKQIWSYIKQLCITRIFILSGFFFSLFRIFYFSFRVFYLLVNPFWLEESTLVFSVQCLLLNLRIAFMCLCVLFCSSVVVDRTHLPRAGLLSLMSTWFHPVCFICICPVRQRDSRQAACVPPCPCCHTFFPTPNRRCVLFLLLFNLFND